MPTATKSLSEKFSAMAESMQATIDVKRRPMHQNATPKRMKEYNTRLWEADNLERTQKGLRALADAIDKDCLPSVLEGVSSKARVADLVHKGLKPGGHYDVFPSSEYRDQTEAGQALQGLVDHFSGPIDKKQERKRLLDEMESRIRFRPIPGFFPTPVPVIRYMMQLASLDKPFLTVLEPSAGKGDIVEELATDEHGRPTHAVVHCVEIQPALRDILGMKGHELVGCDFLEFSGQYDRILMNPPFENLQDVDHVRHAYDCLKPSGRLVAVMSESAFFRSTKKATEFRDWMDSIDATCAALPDGAFSGSDAFVRTGAKCRLLIANRT